MATRPGIFEPHVSVFLLIRKARRLNLARPSWSYSQKTLDGLCDLIRETKWPHIQIAPKARNRNLYPSRRPKRYIVIILLSCISEGGYLISIRLLNVFKHTHTHLLLKTKMINYLSYITPYLLWLGSPVVRIHSVSFGRTGKDFYIIYDISK